MNALADLGMIIVTDRQAHVHVSGHPGRPELAQMYDWIRPQIIVPVHGETRHMAEQARFALAHGVPKASSRRMATSSGSRPMGRRSSARSGSAGWSSTATSSCPPTAPR